MAESRDWKDPFEASRLLPRLVAGGDAAAACRAVLRHAGNPAVQAELMAALLTPGLAPGQRQDMADAICRGVLPDVLAQLGSWCFSFPLLRFAAQRGPTAGSLMEAAGYKRLERVTDLRDASLPDPVRDLFGVGYVWAGGRVYVEYRRAYLLYADENGALLIRNGSYFFGRDRLRHAVYVSTGPHSAEDLAALSAAEIEGGIFKALSPQHAEKVAALAAGLRRYDRALHDWIWGEGLPVTLDFLREKAAQARDRPYIAIIREGWPAWAPLRVMALDAGVIADLAQGRLTAGTAERLVMLSSPGGDFPL